MDRCVALHQVSDARYVIKKKGKAFIKNNLSGIRAPGTVASEYSKCGLALCMGDFWQQYPVELAVSSGMMRGGYNGEINGRIFRFDPGLSKRLRFVIRPYRSDKKGFEQARSITRRLREFIRPLIAHPSPDWFCKSEAFGPIPPADKKQYPCFERVVSLNGAKVMAQHERRGEYGMRDFGDWFDWESDRRGIWMNMEYDVPHGLFLQYVRSGDRSFFGTGVAAARHYMDIDCIHPNSASDHGAGVHIHSKNHTKGGVNYGHIWAKGVLDYYFLTGDRRALRVARQMAEYCLNLNPKRLRAKERNIGWPLQVLMDVYNATLDQRYLAGAQKLAHEACEWQNPHRGVWEHTIHPSRKQGGVPFMAGILADGLEKYYRVTKDSKAADAILLGAEWLWTETRERPGVYLYKQTLHHGAHPDLRLMNWLLCCYDITGEKRYAAEARNLYREEMKRSLHGTVPKRYPPGTDNYFAIRLRGSLRLLRMFPEVDKRFTRSHERLVTSLAKKLRFLRHGPYNNFSNGPDKKALQTIRRANRCGDMYSAWDEMRNLVVGKDWNMQQTAVALARCGYGRLVSKLGRAFWNDEPKFQRALARALYQGGCFQEAARLRRKLNK